VVLKRFFGQNSPSIAPRSASTVVHLTDRSNQRVEKQLAKCMKEIQQLMVEKRNVLKTDSKIKVVLHTVH
jgi:hypothetical protein